MGIKKERIITYLFVCILIGAVITLASLYFIKHGFTGFAVFEQKNQTDFDEGTWTNLNITEQGIFLSENQTNGTYLSKIYGASEDVLWNNLTWQGQGDLNFEVRSCSSEDCFNESFIQGADLAALNLTGRYFQYHVYFYNNDSLNEVILDYSPLPTEPETVSVTISEPSGTKSLATGIPIEFIVIGDNLTCWYNLNSGENTTLENCLSSSFDVSEDGDYVFNLYVNNSLGAFDSDSSNFIVNTTDTETEEEDEEDTEEEEVISEENITIESEAAVELDTFKLTVGAIQNLVITKNESKEVSWSVKNTGTTSLTNCQFNSLGEFPSWINYTQTKSLAVGEEYKFVFDVNVPEETEPGIYNLGVSAACQETGGSVNFVVEVVTKKLDFNLINVRKTTDEIKIIYSLEELSGLEQNISMRFSLFDLNNEKISEAKDNKILPANSTERFRILMPFNSSLETNASEERLNLLVNLDSEIYSTSVQESIILGRTVTGFAIFGRAGAAGNIITLILIVLFLVAAFFIIKKVRKFRKGK